MVKAVPTSIATVIVNVADCPLDNEPIVQRPVESSYAPKLATDELKVTPAGKASSTATLVASLGPLLVMVMTKSITSPSTGEPLVTVFVKNRSAMVMGVTFITASS